MFLLTISALLGFSQVPIAEGEISWNGFLKQVGFGGTQVYEVSGVSVIPPTDDIFDPGSPVEFRCLDGDWLLNGEPIISLSIEGIPVDRTDIVIVAKGNVIKEFEPNVREDFFKKIGWEGFAEISFADTNTFSDTLVTISGLCFSPSSLMTVGGEWIATDTTALIIGYSVLNAYWLAPMAIGIGLGIYLVKRKIE